ncbi:hypothetical protein MN032_16550 [Agromyces atrinae]|uniref:four-carbon acid sugar kinase family protein n=1 Tax=Agromyces atrinae TaxID=592376 RepID=UPI001F5AC819|nr:four-carbon acid sugar kinase family protein [Agromyces atrinae]MCI2959299.1 hypothetical protein [Agromyces atrinae]
MPMNESELLASVPEAPTVDVRDIAARVADTGRVLVVLDDDPTGTQSVADLPVLARWDVADFEWAFDQGAPAVYVLTNSRSLDAATAAERNREVVTAAQSAAAARGIRLGFASRSDSTLRGHFPLETDVITETLAGLGADPIDAVILVPAFPDAGRVTIGGTHYMRVAGDLQPVGETEFARDSTFGYSASALPEWVAEKTGGRIPAADVVVLDLGTVRRGGAAIAETLIAVPRGSVVAVDVVDENDLRLLALGLDEAERAGRNHLYRVGPPFVRARIGQEVRSPLTIGEIEASGALADRGGLIVVGSHVGLTTRQLAALRAARPDAVTIELPVHAVLDEESAARTIDAAVEEVARALPAGDVIVHTSRELVRTDDPDESLDISRRVSDALVAVVRRSLDLVPPRFVIAKGGITSSDVASRGLEIARATVRGPLLPGIVSLWAPADGPALGIPYIVFAGNVGGDDSLADVVDTLRGGASRSVATEQEEN